MALSPIYSFKGLGNVAKHLLDVPPREIAISTILMFVLEFGIASEAKRAASFRVKLEQKGRLIEPYDILIVAVALINASTLDSHNTSEFQRVEGLKVVNGY